jgi:DNA-directed RNA polymerase subunit RPC12/RpoP
MNNLEPVKCQYCGNELVVISQTQIACTKCSTAKLEKRIERLEGIVDDMVSKNFKRDMEQSRLEGELSNKSDKWF